MDQSHSRKPTDSHPWAFLGRRKLQIAPLHGTRIARFDLSADAAIVPMFGV
jgi:hypothetical protein